MSKRIIRQNEMLTEQQCGLIDQALREDVEPRKVAACLCLHMGLTLSEVTALRWKDVDVALGLLTLRYALSAGAVPIPIDPPRVLPMPPHIVRYLQTQEALYQSGECYIITGEKEQPLFYHMQNILTSIALKVRLGRPLSTTDLRNAFIRRCIQSGMDLYSICAYVGIKQPNAITTRFAAYLKPRFDQIGRLESPGRIDSATVQGLDSGKPKRMNLLILGAGSQGALIKEIAEAIGVFYEIAFLDDKLKRGPVIGQLSDLRNLAGSYPLAIPSFGDCARRKQYMDMCERYGYIVPSLLHPNATVSSAAVIDRSVIIEARSVISAGAVIGRGALISSGSVVSSGAQIGEFAHVDVSATIEKNAVVEAMSYVPSGMVIRSEKPAVQGQ